MTTPPAARFAFAAALLFFFAGCATAPAPKAADASAAAAQPATSAPEPAAPADLAGAAAAAALLGEPAAEPAAAPADDAASAPETTRPPELIDPIRPEVRLNPNDGEARSDLWARVRRGFRMPELETELARDRTQWYASQPEYFQRMTERGSRYLFHIVEEVERRNMPTELALLPFIESAFNPQAMSSAKASGMWQFMPSTGRVFDLKQNVFRDDRRDVLASTRAALDYLQKLYGMFGDWHLALAAYNWGEGSVGRAIARNRKAGLATDYTSLKMPRETQYYVPKLQAVKNLIARPEAFGLSLPEVSNHPYFLSVALERDIDVALAAKLADMDLDDFKALNPQMNKPVILAAGTARVLLPYDNANEFVRRLPQHRGPLATWTAWVAPKTLRPAEAAKLVGMNEDVLRDVNHIPPRMLVQAGSTLLVPRGQHRQADVSEHLADHATMALAPDGPVLRKLALKAGRNDSVASVARRYRVSAAQVGQWNGVGTAASFKAGQTIVVFVAAKAVGTAKKSTRVAAGLAKGKKAPSTAAKRHVRVAKR
jgi:membrane-bound lytic murein transglycosylase D